MRNEVAQPIIDVLFQHLDEGSSWTTAPAVVQASTYADPSHLAFERESLFARWPQVVALSPDLPEPGSFITRDMDRLGVVLTRAHDGVVRAFANVCAHRGAQVVRSGRGCQRRLTCPYHAWSYTLDGALAAVPDPAAFPDIDVPGPGLVELPAREEHGLVWLTPSPGAAAPEPSLGAIAEDLETFDVGGHRHWRSHHFDLPMNWKLVIDTFLEPYHFAALHRNTVGPLFIANLCHAERFGNHVREILPRRTLADLRDQAREEWDIVPHSAMVYVLFPNTVFVMQIDHIETWRVLPHPTDPNLSHCDLDFYIPDVPETASSERHWERNWKLTIDTVINEDFAAMAGVQRGLGSGVLEHVKAGANEPALSLFHASLADGLAQHR